MRRATTLATTSLSVAALLALAAGASAEENLSRREFSDLKRQIQRGAARDLSHEVERAIRELGRDDSERAAEFLATVAAGYPEVYAACRDAIASMRADEVTECMLDALDRRSTRASEKILYVDVIAERSDDRSLDGLSSALESWERQPEVARAAVAAIEGRRATRCVDAVIDLMEELEDDDPDGLLMNQVRDALVAITGESFENAHDWRNFWEPRKQSFRPRTGDAPRHRGTTGERDRPTFFGSELKSNRIVFVIDVSGSMQAADPVRPGTGGPQPRRGPRTGPGGQGGGGGEDPGADSRVRIERAKYQLAQAVEALPDDAAFTILAYNGALMGGPGGPGGGAGLPGGAPDDPDAPLPPKLGGYEWLLIWDDELRLQGANERNKESAKEWISRLTPNGMTFTYNALRVAFEVEGADLIVLLSDGAPTEVDRETGQEMTTDRILEKVAELNRFRRLRIDTFGFDAEAGAQPRRRGGGSIPAGFGGGGGLGKFMQDLADQNGGDYTRID